MRLPRRPLVRILQRIIFFALLVCVAAASQGQSSGQLPQKWDESVRKLAENIVAECGPMRVISIEVNNISSLRVEDTAEIQEELGLDLRRLGVRTESVLAAEVQVKVTLSEGIEGYVWVAAIHRGGELQVAIVSLSRSANHGAASIPSMSIQRNVLWVQAEKMLDFAGQAFLNGQGTLETALLPDQIITELARSGGSLRTPSSSALSNIRPSRDTRGELIDSDDHQLRTYVGNTTCIGGAGGGLHCGEQSGDGWPFPDGSTAEFIVGRNYFSGFAGLNDKSKQAQFFTAATIDVTDGGYSRILAEIDGRARLYESSWNPSATFEGWGDEIATIRTGCDGAWQVFVTGSGDWTQPDRIQIYEIRNHQGVAVGQSLNFPGPILALWPSADGKSARVVSRNLKTGMYEASIVSVTCGN
jgi:hypothetical protein